MRFTRSCYNSFSMCNKNEKMKKEIWIEIPQYEGIYQASTHGRIKSLERKVWMKRNNCFKTLKEKILKPFLIGEYLYIDLSINNDKNQESIHIIIAMTFLDHVPDGHKIVVDHKDNDKTNNFLNNLQLITQRENCSKDRKGYSSEFIGVSFFKRDNKWKSQIQIEGKRIHLGYFNSEIEASQAYQNKLISIL